jgi:isoquinoline 1-oxidoreductase subunit alpha
MAAHILTVNGKQYTVEADPNMPLLWAIRDYIGLTGTKFGCGIAQCGACTIHLDGKAVRSCVIPINAAVKKEIVTIEGLSAANDHPVQQAWVSEQVPQCGYCQSGQIMAAAALLKQYPHPTEQQIHTSMQGLICRCGTYPRIKKAILKAVTSSSSKTKSF